MPNVSTNASVLFLELGGRHTTLENASAKTAARYDNSQHADLPIGRDAKDDAGIREHSHKEQAQECANDIPFAAGQGTTADDCSRNHAQIQSIDRIGDCGVKSCGINDARQSTSETDEDETK